MIKTSFTQIYLSCFQCSAAAYSQNGEYEKAVEDAKFATEVDPAYSKAYSRLGYVETFIYK